MAQIVTNNIHYFKLGLAQSYPNVFENPRGYAFLLNAVNFSGRPKLTRHGSENDYKNLQDVLDQLGYKFFPYEDLTLEVGKVLPINNNQ